MSDGEELRTMISQHWPLNALTHTETMVLSEFQSTLSIGRYNVKLALVGHGTKFVTFAMYSIISRAHQGRFKSWWYYTVSVWAGVSRGRLVFSATVGRSSRYWTSCRKRRGLRKKDRIPLSRETRSSVSTVVKLAPPGRAQEVGPKASYQHDRDPRLLEQSSPAPYLSATQDEPSRGNHL